jgi:hypothetical protein
VAVAGLLVGAATLGEATQCEVGEAGARRRRDARRQTGRVCALAVGRVVEFAATPGRATETGSEPMNEGI